VPPTTTTNSKKPSTITTEVTTTQDVGIEPPKPSALVNLTIPVFDRYGPAANYSDGDNLRTLPKLDSIVLTCNCIKSSATAASALKTKHIRAMSDEEVYKCLDILGMLPWPSTDKEPSWGELLLSILKKSTAESESDHSFLKRDQMIQLNNLLPDIAEYNLDVLDVGRENIDGLSVLGRHGLSSEVTKKLVQRYFKENNISQSNHLIATEVAGLGQLLCGFSDEQWISQITPDIFKSTLVEHLSRLNCNVSTPVSDHLRNLLINLYGPTNSWTSSDVFSIGWVAAVLTESDLSSLPVSVIEGLSPKALIHMDLSKLSSDNLRDLSPHTASFIRKSQLSSRTPESKRRAIRVAGGESIRLRSIMEGLESVEGIMADDVSTDSSTEKSTSGQPVTATIEFTILILFVLGLQFIS